MNVSFYAPAKINLHLAVMEKRTDGFHAIESLFQALDLCDDISLNLENGRGISVSGDCACALAENTMFKAARAFLDLVKLQRAIDISIEKRIPIGGGLGGGSSDAAAVLRALNTLHGNPLGKDDMDVLAASIGSDVPFFLTSPCAFVTGRGEFVKPIVPRTDLVFVLVAPGFSISSREAYAAMDATRPGMIISKERGFQGISHEYSKAAAEWNFFNDFWHPIHARFPVLGNIIDMLKAHGAAFAAMSGSGSTLFGVFSDNTRARKAVMALSSAGFTTCLAPPLAEMPALRYNAPARD